MKRALHIAIALGLAVAAAQACGKGDTAVHGGLPGGGAPGIGTVVGGGGDAGADAGMDGGADAGTDAGTDGGCAGALARPVTSAVDFCSGFTQPQPASLIDLSCTAQLYLSSVATCAGQLSGSQNAFTGSCENLNCSAPSLPGRITCEVGPGVSCAIVVCGSASDAGCP